MYVTSQRVQGDDGHGINAFIHGGVFSRELDWQDFDRGELEIGDLLRQRAIVSPGGNSVLSFLDVVSPGTLQRQDVSKLLSASPIVSLRRSRHWRLDGLAARFEICGGEAYSPDFDTELEALVRVAESLLAEIGDPLEIRRKERPDAVVFELSPASVERLRPRHGSEWKAPRFRAGRDVLAQWRELGMASLQEQVVRTLTGLTDAELEEEGGVCTVTDSA